MSLPKGWVSDYENGRWVYRYKTTGLIQYHFPRPGDEFPELIGLGFGPLDFLTENELTDGHQAEVQPAPNGKGGNGVAANNGGGFMSATGYFDPDILPNFDFDDVSPVGGDNNGMTPGPTAELPEASEQIRSPIGFVAELASGETAKCADEFAPIELDSTQIAPSALQTNQQQNGPAELPTHSPAAKQQPVQRIVQENTQPVDEYPLVSASFAYPPLRTATRPVDNAMQQANPPLQEQKVLGSQRPADAQPNQIRYDTWKPTDGAVNEVSKKSNRQSMALSSISVLQSQNSELGSMEQKRHSLSGPLESSGAPTGLPDILRPPSGPKLPTSTPAIPSQVEPSTVPAVLQPAAAPSGVPRPQNNSQPRPVPNGFPRLPGSGARHESISSGSGLPVPNSSSSQIPSVLKPAQTPPISEVQPPIHTHPNNVRPGAHRVNTSPAQTSSQTSSPPKIGGPGIYVFREITSVSGSAIEQAQNKLHNPVAVKPDSDGQGVSMQKPHQPTEQFHSIMSQPLPIIAPLSISKPASPDKPSSNAGIFENPRPLDSQTSAASNALISHETSQVQVNYGRPTSSASPSQGVNTQKPPYTSHSASPQGSASSSPTLPQKLPRKPLLPQRPENVSLTSESPPGQQTQAHNQQLPSVSGSPQHSSPVPQSSMIANNTSASPHSQGQPSSINTPNSQTRIQGSNYSLAMSIQVSSEAKPSGNISNQPAAPIPHNPAQRPSSNHLPNQRPSSTQPGAHAISQRPNQNMAAGIVAGQNKPQSPSPVAHSVSPLQSQVSSPTSSVASLHRPPSSASSHTPVSGQGVVAQNRPPSIVHQSSPHVTRPTGPPALHSQGSPQATQSVIPPVNGASKPFPMLPGQVKPLPSQFGSPSIPISAQQTHAAPAHTQYSQGQVTPMRPQQQQQQQQMNQQATPVAAHRPPQQHHVQGHHPSTSNGTMQGQQMPGTMQHGQPRPPVQMMSAQQHTPVHSAAQVQNPTSHVQQGMSQGQIGQQHNGQTMNNSMNGTSIQLQASFTTHSPSIASSQIPGAQASFSGQQMVQGQQQQLTHTSGSQSSLSQAFGGGKPFDSAQATAALTDAGKKMKKWAKKTWHNQSVKQTTAAVGGAIIAESLGGDAIIGASLANKIYGASQSKPQNGQPQRPPVPQHAHTAPPQAQSLQGTQQVQAMNRPQLQQGMQPMGVQTPGRPPVVQNPGMMGAPMNNNVAQPQPGMMNQQQPYQISRPPVGRPPLPQAQQPATFGQPVYQAAPSQPFFQAQQSPYQMRPNQPIYQTYPGQPLYPAQVGVDPYTAMGATIGGALNALATSKPDTSAPANSQEHHSEQSEPHHEAQSEQYHGGQHEQSHAEQSEPHYTNQSENYYDTYSEQNHTGYSEQHQESNAEHPGATYTEENHGTHSEQQPDETQIMIDNSNTESYFAPQSDTTIINNTTINNVDNSATAEATEVNNMNYTDNTEVADTTNMNTETMSFADTTYTDTTNTNTEATAFTDTTFVDSSYTDTMNMNGDTTAFADSSYMDSSYTDTTYMDSAYVDTTTMVDMNVDMNVDMSMDMSSTGYMEDQTYTMNMEESMSVDASASFVEESTVDYSGGDWGGEEW